MRETLQSLVDPRRPVARQWCRSRPPGSRCEGSGSSVSCRYAPYHWLLYAESLYFDIGRARSELGWEPRHSSVDDGRVVQWFLAHRGDLDTTSGSHHQSLVRPGLLRLLKLLP